MSADTASVLARLEGDSLDAKIASLAEERSMLSSEASRLRSSLRAQSLTNDRLSVSRESTPFTEDEVGSEEAKLYIRQCRQKIKKAEEATKKLKEQVGDFLIGVSWSIKASYLSQRPEKLQQYYDLEE